MRINKSLGYAINWLSTNGKLPEEIAKELELTTKQVTSYLEKNNIQTSPDLAIKSSPVKKKSKDLMIRHTRDKKINSVSIMTKEASEINDAMRSKLNNSVNKNIDCIFNPNN